jgi:hypothetical protein
MPLTRLSSARLSTGRARLVFRACRRANQDRVMVVCEELIAENLASFLSAAAALTGSNR